MGRAGAGGVVGQLMGPTYDSLRGGKKKPEEPKKDEPKVETAKVETPKAETKLKSQGKQADSIIPQKSKGDDVDWSQFLPKAMSPEDYIQLRKLMGVAKEGTIPNLDLSGINDAPSNLPLDLTPLALWLDNQYGTNYAPGMMETRKFYADRAGSSPAIQQVKAQGRLEQLKHQLKGFEKPSPLQESQIYKNITQAGGGTKLLDTMIKLKELGLNTEFKNQEAQRQNQKDTRDTTSEGLKKADNDPAMKAWGSAKKSIQGVREALDADVPNKSFADMQAVTQLIRTYEDNAVFLGEVANAMASDPMTEIKRYWGMLNGGGKFLPSDRETMKILAGKLEKIFADNAQQALESIMVQTGELGGDPGVIEKSYGPKVVPKTNATRFTIPGRPTMTIPDSLKDQFLKANPKAQAGERVWK
jgi:hypothetical protein